MSQESPLARMTVDKRLAGRFPLKTGVTVVSHPMAYDRDALSALVIVCSSDLQNLKHGQTTWIAGWMPIACQRPGTAKGFVFLSLEDQSGISNAIVTPHVYEQAPRRVVTYGKFLLIEGKLQNQENVGSGEGGRRLSIWRSASCMFDLTTSISPAPRRGQTR